jgi:DNA polymerase
MKTEVYDIVNAGPRHRFTANGVVVSNCGKMIQPQNLAKESIPYQHIIEGIGALKADVADIIGYDIMKLTSSALRYAIVAPPGKKFCVADLANIEGRALAYLAGEEWKIQAFRDFDAGIGPDMYKAAYAKSFGVDPNTVTKAQRTIGKVLELSMGYGGSAAAFVSFAMIYRLNLDELAAQIMPTLPPETLKEAEAFYDWLDKMDIKAAQAAAVKEGLSITDWELFYAAKSTRFLPRHQFVAFDALKRLWRQGHPETVKFWRDTEDALRCAINIPNQDFHFGRGLIARRSKAWVRIILPSGHNLCYPAMQVYMGSKRQDDDTDDTLENTNNRGAIRFRGVDQFSKKWQWIYTHGSKAVENIVQAFSRDIFKYGQLNAEKDDYAIVLPVHDELVAEVPDTPAYSVHRLEQIMASPPPWAPDIPLAAEGFEDYRYHKPHDD